MKAKRDVAVKWCALASECSAASGGKPWKYVLIPHDNGRIIAAVDGLAKVNWSKVEKAWSD